MNIPLDIDSRVIVLDSWINTGDWEPIDRYTIVIDNDLDNVLASSEFPFNPQGFGQHVSVGSSFIQWSRHKGQEISFYDLPEQVKKFVIQDVNAIDKYLANHE